MSPVSTVLLLGTFDTKGHEYAYVRDRLRDLEVGTLLVDVAYGSLWASNRTSRARR